MYLDSLHHMCFTAVRIKKISKEKKSCIWSVVASLKKMSNEEKKNKRRKNNLACARNGKILKD
jgi:hypothetical protein